MTDYAWAGYLVGAVGALVGLAGWLRNSRGDTAEQARWMGRIDEKLEKIERSLTGLDGIPGRVKAVEDRLKDMERKLERHMEEHGRDC